MSSYEVNCFLHSLAASAQLRERVAVDPADALTGFNLSDEEQGLLLAGEVGRLYLLGADGFLLHNLQRLTTLVPDVATYSERMRAVRSAPRSP